ncbi:hypothetical protein A8F94_22780 [Bacillus sp. FJAT-27225]|uniref:hypothetical protein n=1 Tax=Bacillus sp. FJAT-27225 TaxID=1743144 RepID=UPI00080C33B5|nr:hypothetical protein [Bacillus sp. FJAT-27225]OCA81685.1 hypothetical protein A8F94_22780 [Bacillus sp. FJAT-27225]
MKNRRYLLIGLAGIIIFFSIKMYNDYKEKGLNDLIGSDLSEFDYLVFNEGVEQYQARTDQADHAKKLNDFFSQYRVKRMKDDEWNPDVSNERGFNLTIYENGKPIIAHIYENRLLFLNDGNYYTVVNGPIDMDWIKRYTNQFRQ